ncbi:MAG: hypothetical protein WDO73_33350 [Ignavibacteriota bacterium]
MATISMKSVSDPFGTVKSKPRGATAGCCAGGAAGVVVVVAGGTAGTVVAGGAAGVVVVAGGTAGAVAGGAWVWGGSTWRLAGNDGRRRLLRRRHRRRLGPRGSRRGRRLSGNYGRGLLRRSLRLLCKARGQHRHCQARCQ